VLVGDQRALRVHGERGAAEDFGVGVLDDEQRDRVLVIARYRAVIDGGRARDPALARFGGIELRAQPGD